MNFNIIFNNLLAALRGRSVRFEMTKDGFLFVKEGNRLIMASNRERGFKLYRRGIDAREEFIFSSYCLKNISFEKGDVVIDCGANYGDLFLRLSRLIDIKNYFAFEPNPVDFMALKFNVAPAPNIFNLALGNQNFTQTFYVATRGGDSSLIEPKKWDHKISTEVVRLDSFISENNIERIKLLKLEAEGFEPEILEGLGSMIKRCDYIALDGGYERGKNCEQTLTYCTNYLLSNGFEIIDIYFPWHRALYRRK